MHMRLACQPAVNRSKTRANLMRFPWVVSRDGDVEYWATNDLVMDELRRLELAERGWAVEEYHRVLKQCCNVERCQARRHGPNAIT